MIDIDNALEERIAIIRMLARILRTVLLRTRDQG